MKFKVGDLVKKYFSPLGLIGGKIIRLREKDAFIEFAFADRSTLKLFVNLEELTVLKPKKEYTYQDLLCQL